jgi:ribosomal protein S16
MKGFPMQRRITIRMAADLHDQLVRYAVGQGVTLSRAVRELIEQQKAQSAAQLGRWFFR